MAELYWMALCRDVPFPLYGNDPLTNAAAVNLATMDGYFDPTYDVPLTPEGGIDPLRHLFRTSYVGVDKGPMVSQLLVKSFTIDSIEVEPKQTTFVPDKDYMTDYDNWLYIQARDYRHCDKKDGIPRYIRNARDLSRLSVTDTAYSATFRAAKIILGDGKVSEDGINGPYTNSKRDSGFVTFGSSHLFEKIGAAEYVLRISWYLKWNVHRLLRPEAYGGLLHHTMTGIKSYPIHPSILNNHELMERVAKRNEYQNIVHGRGGAPTYLLSQSVREGSPIHPSFPAAHSVGNGAYITVLKAFVGLERGMHCVSNPVVPSDDGLILVPYSPSPDEECVGPDGEITNGLTYEGELNKLASNIAFGRSMLGVHYRCDNTEGLITGEIAGIRLLQQELPGLGEAYVPDNPSASYMFRLFRGKILNIYSDGSYSIGDGPICYGSYHPRGC
ncbi:unnamed protein product [Discosporangium mesarthrocarpum]